MNTPEQARAALAEYNAECAAGGEPEFPEWAGEIIRKEEAKKLLAKIKQNKGDENE